MSRMELNEILQQAGRYLFLLPENRKKDSISLNEKIEVKKDLYGNNFIWLEYGENIEDLQAAYEALLNYIIKKEISTRETLLFLQPLKNLCQIK